MTNRILRNRYQIISELGKGGFGTTYLAVDLDLPDHPQCVVKQLTLSDPRPQVFQEAKKLFDKEAKTLQRLGKHDQIPQLFAYFEEGGQFYLVQEFIEGNNLEEEIYPDKDYSGNKNIPGKKISEQQAIQLLTEILEVLKYVHDENVIHRDLKPQNIMRRKSDGKIVLIDFGAVKEIKGLTVIKGGQTSITIAVGTPGYMPSEQAAGQPKFCSDIYALGITIIETLTGMPPNKLAKDNSTSEIIWKNQVNVNEKFARILDKMVADYWRHRHQNIDELMVELIGNNLSQKTTVLINKNPSNYQQPTVLNASLPSPTLPSPILPLPSPTTPSPPHRSWLKIVFGVGIGIVCSAALALIINPQIFNREKISGDYSTLEKLLAQEKWKEADIETENIMLQITNRKSVGWLDSVFIDRFPCSDLKKINQLWVENSNRHFGFSIQKPIYLATGNKLRIFQNPGYESFGAAVGWRQNGRWLKYDELVFSLNSPKGHLPAPHRRTTSSGFAPYPFLIDRLVQCNIE